MQSCVEEQEHFQKIGRQHGVVVASTQWPLFEGASQKLLSLINLYARKHITAKGHWSTFNGEQLPSQAAILVLRGERLEGKESLLNTLQSG